MGTSQRRVPPENRAGDAGTMLNSIRANLGVVHRRPMWVRAYHPQSSLSTADDGTYLWRFDDLERD